MNLFQVPSPVVGLMGRRPGQQDQGILTKLLAQGGGPSLEQVMAMQQAATPAPQEDEAARRERMRRLMDDEVMAAPQNSGRRPSILNALGRSLAPNMAAAYDAEQARIRAEEMAPQTAARNRQILESIQDPRERALFLADPEEWAKNVGQQFAPQVVGPGGVQAIGGRGVVGAPTYFESGDTLVERDPLSRTVAPVWTRTEPSIAERTAQTVAETGRINALNPVNVGANVDLVDPQTGRAVYQGYRPPSVVSTPQGGTTNVIDPQTGAVINSVQGNPASQGGRGGGSFDATTRGALRSATDAANLARSRAADARRFVALNRQRGTGLGAALLGPAAGLDPTYAEMRAISARLIPKEREPGSGTMSDRDVALYGRAVLDIDKPGPANEAMANVVIAQAERDADYAAFLDEYAQRNGNLAGSTEDWTAYVNANPLFDERDGNTIVRPRVQDWRTFMGYGERQRGGAQSRGGNASGGAPVRVNSPQQAMALPSGTRFITPDGQVRVRQ